MNTIKVALLKVNGDIVFKDFCYENDFIKEDLELLIENKGNNFKLIEEGRLDDKYYNLFGYESGSKFSKHEFNKCNLFDDAIMVIYDDITICDIDQYYINNYFDYITLESDNSISFSDDEENEYDFNDDWIINDL